MSILSKLSLSAAAIGLLTTAAQAQMPTPSASYSGQMKITSTQAQTMYADIYAKPYKQRVEMNTEQGKMVSIVDMSSKNAYSYSPDLNGPMGNMAMKINFEDAMKQYGGHIEPADQPVRIGMSSVAGQACTLYQAEDTTVCVTGDGIMMKATHSDGAMEMTSLNRGYQQDSLFTLPADRQVMDLNNVMGSIGGYSGSGGSYGGYGNTGHQTETPSQQSPDLGNIIANEAGNQVKNEVQDQTRKQMGNSIGGAVGGNIVGGALGNEVGGAAKDLVGGLFGKKKKKKKEKKEDE